jgi:hypothetical protein
MIRFITKMGLRSLAVLLLANTSLQAFAPHNFFKPYNYNLRYQDGMKKENPLSFGLNFEVGSSRTGKNADSATRNILALHEDTQSFIPALINAQSPAVTTFAAVLYAAGRGLDDDGTRGHVALNGHFEMIDATLRGRYVLPLSMINGKLAISAAMPIRSVKVSGVTAQDKTANIFPADTAIRPFTQSFASIAAKLKDLGNVDWSDFSSRGVGDLVIMLDWMNNYQQQKDGLENVQLIAKIGVSLPTAPERDEDKVFSISRGNDGAWSVPFGLGLNLDFQYNIRLGLEAEFEIMFDHSREFRMKTAPGQTQFMLLNKGRATIDHGFNWHFNLMAQAYRFWRGCSLGVTYEYAKHDDDRLTPHDNSFDVTMANSASWLREYNMHHFIFKASWDGSCYTCPLRRFTPHASIFYKMPIDGRNVILTHSFGGQLGVSF